MKNKELLLMTVSLVFLGCTKTIQVNSGAVASRPYPVVYEEVVSYEPRVQEQRRVVYNEIPQREPVLSARADNMNIRPLEASDKLREGVNVMLLDVRTPEEIPLDGKIASSMLIPLNMLANNLHRLDKSKQIIVYCHTGNRSLEAMRFLRSRGFDTLNMLGGLEAWKHSHLSVVRR